MVVLLKPIIFIVVGSLGKWMDLRLRRHRTSDVARAEPRRLAQLVGGRSGAECSGHRFRGVSRGGHRGCEGMGGFLVTVCLIAFDVAARYLLTEYTLGNGRFDI